MGYVIDEIKRRVDLEIINAYIYTCAIALRDDVYAVFNNKHYADKAKVIIQELKNKGKKVLVFDLITPQRNLEYATTKEIFNLCYHLCSLNTNIDDLADLAKLAGEHFDAKEWLMNKKRKFIDNLKLAAKVRAVRIPDWLKKDKEFQCDVEQIELIKSLRVKKIKAKRKVV